MHPALGSLVSSQFRLVLFGALILQASSVVARDLPKVSARSWVLMDLDSGYMLSKYNEHLPLHPGGLTKLMTGFVLFKNLIQSNTSLHSRVRIDSSVQAVNGPRIFLQSGDTKTVEQLLSAMFVHSANDATHALVNHLAESDKDMVEQMNRQARVLGMTRTRFENVSGLPHIKQASTAADIGLLGRALVRQYPQHQDFFKTKKIRHYGIDYFNRNALLWRDTGTTGLMASPNKHTGHHLVATSESKDLNLMVVVLGARNEQRLFEAAQALIEYGRNAYQTRLLYPTHKVLAEVPVNQGESSLVTVGTLDNLYVTLPMGTFDQLQAKLEIEPNLQAPIAKGQDAGNLTLLYKDTVIAEHPLVALETIAKGNDLQNAWGQFRHWLRGDAGIQPSTQE